MSNFRGYRRIAVVLVNDNSVLMQRNAKVVKEDGKIIPESAFMEMKANFVLPVQGDIFDDIWYVEETEEKSKILVKEFNEEGRTWKEEQRKRSLGEEQVKTEPELPGFKKMRHDNSFFRANDASVGQNKHSSSAWNNVDVHQHGGVRADNYFANVNRQETCQSHVKPYAPSFLLEQNKTSYDSHHHTSHGNLKGQHGSFKNYQTPFNYRQEDRSGKFFPSKPTHTLENQRDHRGQSGEYIRSENNKHTDSSLWPREQNVDRKSQFYNLPQSYKGSQDTWDLQQQIYQGKSIYGNNEKDVGHSYKTPSRDYYQSNLEANRQKSFKYESEGNWSSARGNHGNPPFNVSQTREEDSWNQIPQYGFSHQAQGYWGSGVAPHFQQEYHSQPQLDDFHGHVQGNWDQSHPHLGLGKFSRF